MHLKLLIPAVPIFDHLPSYVYNGSEMYRFATKDIAFSIFTKEGISMNQHFVFSAPGRTELSGNHTDHQHSCVLAAAVNPETVAEVTLNSTDWIRVQSLSIGGN